MLENAQNWELMRKMIYPLKIYPLRVNDLPTKKWEKMKKCWKMRKIGRKCAKLFDLYRLS